MSYKALIVEDEPLVAMDIQSILLDLGYDDPFIALNGEEALEILKNYKADFALLDIQLGGDIDGIELAGIINKEYRLPFIFLTSHSDSSTLKRARSERPAAYLLKPFDEADLKAALEIALYNYFNPQNYKETFSIERVNKAIPNSLSEKEFEVLSLIRLGKTNKEIAAELDLSVNTIKTHLHRLFAKLDASNRTEAMFKVDSLLK